jgi:branched-chain amino acid transport system permease protein
MDTTARTVPSEVPAGAGRELLPGRDVNLAEAARYGLIGGVVTIFVSAIGMIRSFAESRILDELTLASILLVGIPALAGYLAGRPPPLLEGFQPSRRGIRNVLAGLEAGVLAGVVLCAFALLIDTVNIRDVFVNVTPDLVSAEPRLLTFGQQLGIGIPLILIAYGVCGAAGGAVHLLPELWRGVLFSAIVWILGFGMFQGLLGQLLRGVQLRGVADLLYEPGGQLSIAGAVAVALAAGGLVVLRERKRGVVRKAVEGLAPGPRRGLTLAALAALALFLGALPQIVGPFLSQVLDLVGIFLLLALGLNIVVGFAGLLDLGYVAFFAVGAYSSAVLTSPASPKFSPELIFVAALPFVVMAAAVAGIMVGTPVIRMRGDYLAIVTLGFGEITRLLFLSDWAKPIFGGAQGIIRIPSIDLGLVTVRGPQSFFYAIFAFVIVAIYVSYSLQNSRIGRAWMAMREDEAVAEAMGINIVSAKLFAFIIGAILASFGGALFASQIQSIFPNSFEVTRSIEILVVIIVGGLASVPGVIVGALVLIAMPELLREFEEFRFLVYGGLLIFMMLKRPEGFIPSRRRAQELHEDEVLQDAWLQAEKGERVGGPSRSIEGT